MKAAIVACVVVMLGCGHKDLRAADDCWKRLAINIAAERAWLDSVHQTDATERTCWTLAVSQAEAGAPATTVKATEADCDALEKNAEKLVQASSMAAAEASALTLQCQAIQRDADR